MIKRSKILKYGMLFLAIFFIGIWVFVYFRHFLVYLPRISTILNEIAERPSLMAAIEILSVLLVIPGLMIPFIKWIYSHLKREEIKLPPIDENLRKNTEESFDDFLTRGRDPYWIDFKKGYITKRKEVGEILSKLRKDPMHLIIGDPASGKSVVAKNIGYELCKKGYDVFVIEIKKEFYTNDINEILKIKRKNTLIIIDDVHLDLEKCNNQLLNRIKPKFKILLSGRKDPIKEKEEPRTETPIDRLPRTEVKAIDTVEDILTNFENKKNVKIREEHRVALRKQYGHDLWILSLALSLYNPIDGVPPIGKLCKEIKKNLTQDMKGEYKRIHADNIILPISFFYCYEAPIAMKTLIETLELNERNIWKLVDFGEIIEMDGMLSLHHSSRAKLYLETFKKYKRLGRNVKDIIQKKFGDWYIGLFHLYFQSKPNVCVGLLSELSKEYGAGKTDKDIIGELMKDDETKKAIFERITESMKNVNKLQSVLRNVPHRTFRKEFLGNFSEEYLLKLLNNSKLNQIGRFFRKGYFSINVQNAYQRFSNEFLLKKMNEATLDEIGMFIYDVIQVKLKEDESVGERLALDAIEKLKEVDNLSQKLEDTTLKTISLLIRNINEVKGDPQFIIDKLKPPFDLIRKMKESTSQYIGLFIVDIRRNDAEYLIERFDLIEKLKKSDLRDLGYFIWNISDDQPLSDKYNKIVDDFDLIENIEKSDLNTVNRFLWNLFQTNLGVPKTFIDTKVRNILIDRLNEENEDIGEKLRLVGIFECSKYSLLEEDGKKISGTKILTSELEILEKWFKKYLNPTDPNPFKIALALKGFRAVDKKNTLSFINSHLSLKETIDCLKKSKIKNRKSEQLIRGTLSWLLSIELESEDAATLYSKGETFFKELREYRKAIECYDKALELGLKHAPLWYHKGYCHYKLGEYEKAVECYDRSLELNPKYSAAWRDKGYSLHKLRRDEKAIECYDRALELEPDNEVTWDNKGYSLFRLRKYRKAIECFDKALELGLKYAPLWYKKGYCHYKLEKFEKAIECFDKALELEPNNAVTLRNKGDSLYKLRKYEEAIECYDKAKELGLNIAPLWYNKGYCHYSLGEHEKANESYDKALELEPNNAVTLRHKGDNLSKLGRWAGAIECYDKAKELGLNIAPLWYKKGDCHHNLREYEKAIKCYDEALELEPNNEVTLRHKRVSLSKLRRYQK